LGFEVHFRSKKREKEPNLEIISLSHKSRATRVIVAQTYH